MLTSINKARGGGGRPARKGYVSLAGQSWPLQPLQPLHAPHRARALSKSPLAGPVTIVTLSRPLAQVSAIRQRVMNGYGTASAPASSRPPPPPPNPSPTTTIPPSPSPSGAYCRGCQHRRLQMRRGRLQAAFGRHEGGSARPTDAGRAPCTMSDTKTQRSKNPNNTKHTSVTRQVEHSEWAQRHHLERTSTARPCRDNAAAFADSADAAASWLRTCAGSRPGFRPLVERLDLRGRGAVFGVNLSGESKPDRGAIQEGSLEIEGKVHGWTQNVGVRRRHAVRRVVAGGAHSRNGHGQNTLQGSDHAAHHDGGRRPVQEPRGALLGARRRPLVSRSKVVQSCCSLLQNAVDDFTPFPLSPPVLASSSPAFSLSGRGPTHGSRDTRVGVQALAQGSRPCGAVVFQVRLLACAAISYGIYIVASSVPLLPPHSRTSSCKDHDRVTTLAQMNSPEAKIVTLMTMAVLASVWIESK